MAISIPIPEEAWAVTDVVLGGETYEFEFSFNDRDRSSENPDLQGRWRLSVYKNGVNIIRGIKIIESVSLLGKYNLVDFSHGDLYCLRVNETKVPAGRNNIGDGKDYVLAYFSVQEMIDILGV